jgi:hypothetical protein
MKLEILITISGLLISLCGLIFGIYQYIRRHKIISRGIAKGVIFPAEEHEEKLPKDFSIDKLNERISGIETTLTNLKKLLFDNPESAITVALLKKDIELLEKTVNRIDNNSKWFFTILIGLCLSIIGILIK